jgi:cyclophilin family peptidyl-prolyl cis-trans isomerase/HEAT repeat protein
LKKLILFLPILLTYCTTQEGKINKFSDNTLVTISDLQDRRQVDSLSLFLENENPLYRKEACLAFASVQDSLAATALGKVLKQDEDEQVRTAAAFALGQTLCKQSETALTESLSTEKSSGVLRETLEALGKVLSKENTTVLTNFGSTDSVVLTGKSWGLYRLALRGILHDDVVKAAYENLSSEHVAVRLAAAHFFGRANLPNFADDKGLLIKAANDSQVLIRIVANSALRNLKTDTAFLVLQKNINDNDVRVRVSAIRAMRSFPYEKASAFLIKAMNDSSSQVSVAAAEALINYAPATAVDTLLETARKNTQWRVQSTVFSTVVSLAPKNFPFDTIKQTYLNINNQYQKAALLNVLGRSSANFDFIVAELNKAESPLLLSAAATALTQANEASDFSADKRPAFLAAYEQAMGKGDAAVIGIVAQVLGDSTKQYKSLVKDITFLKTARTKLSLPKDNESLQPLEAAIAYLEGREAVAVKNEFNHPIDWTLVKGIGRDQKAYIKTSKGDIVLTLLVDEAPGSVANFVSLAREQYFNNKTFHRVVPNFVIQGGCNRGDGYGSEDYSIRSEFTNRRYKEGSVGMASAGKDTEGTQWFITHSPTPHLDGRYTIFAEVESGMDVVHAIEVGDLILSVDIK